MNNNIKAAAKSFLNEYKLNEVTLDSLREIIARQGYTIVEFNNIFNDEWMKKNKLLDDEIEKNIANWIKEV